ncbi:hypothetical protein GCM10027187_04490 [Streptosporangium sandarakinum]
MTPTAAQSIVSFRPSRRLAAGTPFASGGRNGSASAPACGVPGLPGLFDLPSLADLSGIPGPAGAAGPGNPGGPGAGPAR